MIYEQGVRRNLTAQLFWNAAFQQKVLQFIQSNMYIDDKHIKCYKTVNQTVSPVSVGIFLTKCILKYIFPLSLWCSSVLV